MDGEDKNEHTHDEEEEFNTPQQLEKKQRKGKEIASETEDQNEEDKRITLKVTQVSERPDRISPIVAYFSTGYDPCKVDPETGKRVHETPKVTVYKHKDDSKKRIQVVVSPPGARVEFVGANYTGEQAAMQTNTYRVGVFNREARTLRILPVAHNKIIRLEPKVKAQETVEEEASGSAVVEELGKLTTGERDRYNTKKAVTRDKKKRALNMGDDAETQKFLDGKLGELDVNTAALESTTSTVARNIPPYDAAATTAKEAYPLEKIIEKGEWSFLEDIYWLLEQGTEAATDAYPVFVRNRLFKLRDIKDDMKKQTVSGALTLLTHLVKFKDRNSMNGFDSAKNHKMPDIFRRKFQSMFKDSESERIPVDKANLLISYVLVLSLHVDNFKTDPEDIAKDLRISTVELRKHFQQLGCKFVKQNSTMVATLPTPLNFPEVNRRRKTRK
ncbi:RNA polymerase I associated factor A49-like [Arabidopsis thaliana x Arabidopsis arenosa]|uniref:RNA polymerase I associated factor A49-like n=1 Tax=Arabidopsis thaliana x Arabidopsis arenosa TaxID=1240361 RepID=A0A8T2ASK7_9BRAS|nr:RNA polymerase I associated factor A49-like [Arabidopsis thaliana x Arabidopsis arenosa]